MRLTFLMNLCAALTLAATPALAQGGHVTVLRREEIDRLVRDARARADAARRQTEALRPQIEEIRRNAQRLREQCERGEIKCEIIITEPARP